MPSTALAFKDEYEYDEVPVSSTEVLEANVIAIRDNLNDVRAAVARIDNDIKSAVIRLEAEIRATAEKAASDLKEFAKRIEEQLREMRGDDKAVREKVDKNFETLNTKIDRNHETLNTKIDKTNEKLVELDKKVDSIGDKLTAFFWVVGVLTTIIGAVIGAGKAFHWF
jgi:chromosome segregation ATPase